MASEYKGTKWRYEDRVAFLMQTIVFGGLKGYTKSVECAERELSDLQESWQIRCRNEAVKCTRR